LTVDILLQQLINGLVLGSIYALIALGYTMVYGILQLINFTHGEVLMIGAMVSLLVVQTWLSLFPESNAALTLGLALLVSAPVCMGLSFLIERLAYRPLRDAPRLAPLITAIGLSITLQTVAMMVFSPNPLVFPDLLPTDPIAIGGAMLAPKQALIVLVSLILMLALILLVQRSRLGRAMRAVAENPRMATLMGVDPNRVVAFTFMLGAALAAVAGLLLALNYNIVHFTMGFIPGLKAFTAAVLGGIGNIPGAVVGGLLLGLIESLGAGYIGDLTGGFLGSHYQDVFAFGVLILVLVFRPSGLLGERVSDRP
jgi:branched-chain amino acid transport system permease protein